MIAFFLCFGLLSMVWLKQWRWMRIRRRRSILARGIQTAAFCANQEAELMAAVTTLAMDLLLRSSVHRRSVWMRWQVRLFIWFSTGAASSHSVSDGLVPFLESIYFLSTLHERALKAEPCQLVGNHLIYSVVPNCLLQLTLDPILAPYLQKQPRLALCPRSSFFAISSHDTVMT